MNSKTKSRNHKSSRKLSSNKLRQIEIQRVSKVTVSKRCQKCGGFNHSKESCSSEKECCWICGSESHYRSNCPLKKNFVKTVKVQLASSSESEKGDSEGERTEKETEIEDNNSTGSLTSEASISWSHNGSTLNEETSMEYLRSVRTHRTSTDPNVCNCRFKSECIRALLDSGASCHVTGNQDLLYDKRPVKGVVLETALGKTSEAISQGHLRIKLLNNVEFKVDNVYYSPLIKDTLISVHQLLSAGYHLSINQKGAMVKKDQLTVLEAHFNQGGYLIHGTPTYSNKEVVRVQKLNHVTYSDIIHHRFGHINSVYLSHAGLPSSNNKFCSTCAATKTLTKPYSKKITQNSSVYQSTTPFGKLHGDLIGPYRRSFLGNRYLLTLIDDYTNQMYAIPLKSKAQTGHKLTSFIMQQERYHETKLKVLLSDQGTEFLSKKVQQFFDQHGITHELSVPYEPSQHGKIERANRTIKQTMKSLLEGGNVSNNFWDLAGVHACRIWNTIPRSKNEVSPYEKMFKKKPQYHKFLVFGARGFTKNVKKSQLKRNQIIMYLGFPLRGSGFLVYVPKHKKLKVVRDLVLNEKTAVKLSNKDLNEAYQDIQSKKTTKATTTTNTSELDKVSVNSSIEEQEVTDNETWRNSGDGYETLRNRETYISRPEPDLAEITEGNIINYPRRNKLSEVQNYVVKLLKTTVPPNNYYQLKHRSDEAEWTKAYFKELNNLQDIGKMSVVKRPSTSEVIKLMEIFIVKYDNIQNQYIPKVRFVARGDLVDDNKSYFSPVASHVGMRILVSLTVKENLFPLRQMDISNAFIYGRLDNYIYIQLPKGHPERRRNDYVWRTKSSIYGLSQSPMVWNRSLDTFLKAQDLKQLISEQCLYVREKDGEILLLLVVYVDDLLFSGREREVIQFKNAINKQFKLKTKQFAEDYVGIQLNQKPENGSVELHQRKHIEDSLKKFDLLDTQRIYSTPMDTNMNVVRSEEDDMLDQDQIKKFQTLVGSLNYLTTCSRPDIAYSVCMLAQKASKPSVKDLERGKRCLMYLKKTLDYSIRYNRSDQNRYQLKVFVDSSFANNSDRRSVHGFAIFLDNHLIHWKTKVSPMVCLSTTEAEFVAVALTMKEVQWISSILLELRLKLAVVCVYCDNQGAVKIFQSEQTTARTKHLDIRLQYVKELFRTKSYSIRYIKTEDNLADLFTKPLNRLDFNRLLARMMNMKIQD